MSDKAVFVKNEIGWNAAFHSWEGTLGIYLKKKTLKMQAIAIAEAPKSKKIDKIVWTRTPHVPGSLAASIRSSFTHAPGGDLESEVRANADYAVFVHEGTRPHRIDAKVSGKKLEFLWPSRGKVIFAKQVFHPGTKPNQFLHRAMTQSF